MDEHYRRDRRPASLADVLRAAAHALKVRDRLERRLAEGADVRERRWLRDELVVAERAVIEANEIFPVGGSRS